MERFPLEALEAMRAKTATERTRWPEHLIAGHRDIHPLEADNVDFEKAREVLELTDARIKTIWLYRRSDKPRNSKG